MALVVFAAAFARDWHLPGLYMDAINPEYLTPGILTPPPPVEYILPGNKVLGDRFPVFTGSYHHGSVQLYAVLPFMKLFGPDIGTFRFFQLLVGGGILALALWLSASLKFGPKRALASGATGILALDPAFVLALRTQAYSCIFPLLLLLGCVLLLRGWRDGARRWLRLLISGVLYGLAVFSYFIYAFFLPVLLWLLFRPSPDEGARRSWPLALSWLAGLVLGYLPFIAGMLLIRRELGGFSQLFDWLGETGDQLGVAQAQEGVFNRIGSVFTESRRVLTGEWPWLMILGRHRTGLMESLKADILVLMPLLVLAIPGLATRGQRRAMGLPIALVLSFGAGALIFGSRLDGHHYSALLPLQYVAFGCACAALWPWDPHARWKSAIASRRNAARGALVVVAVALVSITSLRAEQDFHRALQATGGVRLYSDAIDRFAEDLDQSTPTAAVHTPDWGFAMPVAFLSKAAPVRTIVDVEALRQETCAGKPQVVVLLGSRNEAKLRLVAELARRPLAGITTWSQRDGVPVFQTARFPPTRQCDPAPATTDAPPAASRQDRAAISVTPTAIPACPFIANVRAVVRWSAPRRGRRGVEVVVQPPGAPEGLLTQGDARGLTETGPWAVAGMSFSLRDAVTHRQLALATVTNAPCPGSERRPAG